MFSSSLRFFAFAATLLSATILFQSVESLKLGAPYGMNNQWAHAVGQGNVDWYHHWQNGPVPQMPKHVEYLAMFWGPKYYGLWKDRKKWIHKHHPKAVLSLNEPDVQGQSDVSPKEAVKLHMRELEPLRKKGIKVSSPQIVWNTKWMDEFLHLLRKEGGNVDFIGAHYYGSYKEIGRFQKWIKTLRKKYNMDIWITEYGVTAASGGSSGQVKAFQAKVNKWLRTQSYVKRVAWLGCFAVNNPPDSFASRQNALMTSKGKLRSIGYQYVFGNHHKRDEIVEREEDEQNLPRALDAKATPGAKRHSLQHHRRIMNLQQAAEEVHQQNVTVTPTSINGFPATPEQVQDYLDMLENGEDDEDNEEQTQTETVDCDEICRLRDGETNETELDEHDNAYR